MKYNCPDWNISTIILLDLEVAHTSCPCHKALLKIHLNYHAALQQLYKTHLMSILSSLVILWIFSLFWMFIAHVRQVVDVDYVTLYHVEHCHQKKKTLITRNTGLVMSGSECICVKFCRTFSQRHTNPKDMTQYLYGLVPEDFLFCGCKSQNKGITGH